MPDEVQKKGQLSNATAFPTYQFFQDSNYDFGIPGQNATSQTPQSPVALPVSNELQNTTAQASYEARSEADSYKARSEAATYEARSEAASSEARSGAATYEARSEAASSEARSGAATYEAGSGAPAEAPYEASRLSTVDNAPWATPSELGTVEASVKTTECSFAAEDEFSAKFNFEASLLKIFWRIDIDRNNHVSRPELMQAIENDWFTDDEKLLVKILLACYDDIALGSLLLDAGLTVRQILCFAPFAEIIASQSASQQPNADSSHSSNSTYGTADPKLQGRNGKKAQIHFQNQLFRR